MNEKKRLIDQIARLCEKQYRKGVQHGSLIQFLVQSDRGVADKFREQGMKNEYRTHEYLFSNHKYTRIQYIDRLIAEANMSEMEELIRLLESR